MQEAKGRDNRGSAKADPISMSRFIAVDRDTAYLLPPSVNDWLSEGHLARFVVEVIDRGHGITSEIAQQLFSPFFSTKSSGMGMGLNICRTAIEFHGGTLTHVDNPAGGTIFRFSLPVEAGLNNPDTA